ncbi:carboxypeptidase-like regulatory domain-containing protein [Hymenobacter sp. RP-2-7]|uniref:Carboxypeptidase-like regulatory domain-containing protein n=1 Tax=Hymenobacter polaris TaxID=2682546 RepID=A0A7Y0AG38_9BACT|nr:carboxypeptidase regulatory-like domain-containing protein [Hymenobacter polaris]NML66713.1 carboxypeptidase-like regulatory domain-containing protein [Hymenobacter polaris]
MKLVFSLIIILLAVATGQAQQLQGYFISTTKAWVTDLLFFEGNHFTYNQSTCTGLVKGSGTFIVQNSTLILHFDNTSDLSAIAATTCNGQYKGGFYVKVVDGATNAPLPGVTISISNSRRNSIGTSTTNSGEAWLDYIPTAQDSLLVAYVGYATQRLSFRSFSGTCWKVSLGNTEYVAAGTTYSYPLEAIHHGSFTAQLSVDQKSSYAHFHYKRISATRAVAVLKSREQRQ